MHLPAVHHPSRYSRNDATLTEYTRELAAQERDAMAQPNDDDLATRTRFIGLDPAACALLTALWPAIEPELPAILDGFYQHVTTVPQLKKLIGDQAPSLKQAQTAHWRRLFSGRFDEAWLSGVRA
jgi:hypothetical protein